ncbi:TIGR02221 family CRISPR-associated protein [Thermus sp.]|uniref:TIGR02221 family CRISPR-associated protein n=1 Tax=Thermus sp. TaxID=275 RepID=UPI003D0A7E25
MKVGQVPAILHAEGENMSKVILSFLGTGNYTPTQYRLDGKPYPDLSTPYTQEALLKRYEEEGWVLKVLMTKEAEEKHKEALAERVKYEAVLIPSGHTEGELWQIFNAIVDSIPEGAELIMDISHGFRSQPILALAAVQFLQVVKGVRVRRILYGFYERTTQGGNFFDLTGFLDLIEWTQATRDLLEHGEGLRLRKLLREIHSHSYQVEGPKAKKLTSVGEALDNVEDALDLLRVEEALSSAQELLKHLEAASEDVAQLPRSMPLGFLLERIRERYRSLAAKDFFSPEGIRAQGEMLHLLLQTRRYAQAITLARELLVTLACVRQNWDPREERGVAEAWLNAKVKVRKKKKKDFTEKDSQALRLISLWEETSDLRNDVAHAAMRENPAGARQLAQIVEKVCDRVRALLEDYPSWEEAGIG